MPRDEQQEAAYQSADLDAFETGRFADCIVTCGNNVWYLHRVTLCCRSQWFDGSLGGLHKEGQEAVLRIEEQNPEAVKLCLKYIYGGVKAIDMAKETEGRQPIKFCAELYRSADFFLLKPLLLVIQEYLTDYLDQKMKWISTGTNFMEDCEDPTARVWINDLKAAILEAATWNTPIIYTMLKEFVWAGNKYFLPALDEIMQHVGLSPWLDINVPNFIPQMNELFTEPIRRWTGEAAGDDCWDALVWTPKQCRLSIPESAGYRCVRCRSDVGQEGQPLWDPFNLPPTGWPTRWWCANCVKQTGGAPWRKIHYA